MKMLDGARNDIADIYDACKNGYRRNMELRSGPEIVPKVQGVDGGQGSGASTAQIIGKHCMNERRLGHQDDGQHAFGMERANGESSIIPQNSAKMNAPTDRQVCPKCGKSFSTKQSLSTHMKTAKSCIDQKQQKKIFQCDHCGKVLSSKQMLLYHDGVCTTKTQNEYEMKLKHLQSMVRQSDQSPASTESSTDCYETNILKKCELVHDHAQVPKKCGNVQFKLFPSLQNPTSIHGHASMIISTGLRLGLLRGWSALLHSSREYEDQGIHVSSMVIDDLYTNEICVRVYNSNDDAVVIDPLKPILRLQFFKTCANYNVHMNCVRCT